MSISVHVTYTDGSRRILKPTGINLKKDDKGNTLKSILTGLLRDTGDFIIAEILTNGKPYDRIVNNPSRLDNLNQNERIILKDEKKIIQEEKKQLKKLHKNKVM